MCLVARAGDEEDPDAYGDDDDDDDYRRAVRETVMEVRRVRAGWWLDVKSALLVRGGAGSTAIDAKIQRLLTDGLLYAVLALLVLDPGPAGEDRAIDRFPAGRPSGDRMKYTLELLRLAGYHPPGLPSPTPLLPPLRPPPHLSLLETLMSAWVEGEISSGDLDIDTETRAVSGLAPPADPRPDLEISLLQWLRALAGQVAAYAHERFPDRVPLDAAASSGGGGGGGGGAGDGPDETVLPGVLADGRLLAYAVCYYAPHLLSVTSVRSRTADGAPLTHYARAYNLALVRSACDVLDVDFPFTIEDLLYADDLLRLNTTAFLVALFRRLTDLGAPRLVRGAPLRVGRQSARVRYVLRKALCFFRFFHNFFFCSFSLPPQYPLTNKTHPT
jgi:hypothetical protein